VKAWARRRPPARRPAALLILALPSLASAAQPAATPPSQALAACAGITDSAERLACYDRLVGRGAAPAAPASTAAAPQPAAAAAPAAAAVPAPAPAPSVAPAAPGAAAAAPPSPQSFGLYSAEHPKPALSPSLEARVVALGKSADDHTTVSLDGGARWELLDGADALLAIGDTVTIKRAALGSYLMSTPTKRLLRVRRLN
jgi:hypothetical protein